MSRHHSHLNSAIQILDQFKGEEPFASFLRSFFKQHKKYGSKDRKQISHLCYCYFRLGKSLPDVSKEERILIALFLCSNQPNEIISNLKPEWNEKIEFQLQEKLSSINFPLSSLFLWKEQLSNGIDHEKFCESFLMQPDLFLRLRPGYENMVKEKLITVKIDFKEINSSCIALTNSSKVDDIIELDKEAVVQDYSSQKVGEFIQLTVDHRPLTAWDCCAGSGGKSLLLFDTYPEIKLTVSDIRESILVNLKKRLSNGGIKKYSSFVVNLAEPNLKLQTSNFELIICDAPCTGSGTWSRTPEQLYYFDEKKIDEYSSLQKKIISNIISHLKPGGHFLYITCSVFKKENEEVVEFTQQNFSLEVVKKETLKGYDKKADTMFAALLRKPL